jgi:Uma2 family endonuclease
LKRHRVFATIYEAIHEGIIDMATAALPPPPEFRNVAQLVQQLGDIPLDRIRMQPLPGTAPEEDLLRVWDREKIICELIDGVLVEKARGLRESLLALALASYFRSLIVGRNLGIVTGSDGTIKLFPGLVRIPDVAFISWKRIPGGRIPEEPIPLLVPDIAVEVFSAGNTEAELKRKRREYFKAGVQLVWVIYPKKRTAAVYSAVDDPTRLGEGDTLDGGDVLPGFKLPLAELFSELDRCAPDQA